MVNRNPANKENQVDSKIGTHMLHGLYLPRPRVSGDFTL